MQDDRINEMAGDIKTLLANQLVIRTQVEKTNGRVSSLERFEAMAKGVIAMIVIFVLPIFFLFAKEWITKLGGK